MLIVVKFNFYDNIHSSFSLICQYQPVIPGSLQKKHWFQTDAISLRRHNSATIVNAAERNYSTYTQNGIMKAGRNGSRRLCFMTDKVSIFL